MTTRDQLAQVFATYQTDVQTGFDELKAEIDAVHDGKIPADVQAKINTLDATINAPDVAAKAEVTTPGPRPSSDVPLEA